MHKSVQNLINIQNLIKSKQSVLKNHKAIPQIIAVSKTFKINHIFPLIEYGHTDYGENKVQEAIEKWSEIKSNNDKIKLHLIGKLQTNKVKVSLKLFDYIHSLDNEKLAQKISQYQQELNKDVKLFIQVNLADEKQKSGIEISNLKNFYNYCVNDLSLNVIGLMCLPPFEANSDKYFKILRRSSDDLNLKELSMGMSSDFDSAVINGSTFLRLGTLIMGKRNIT